MKPFAILDSDELALLRAGSESLDISEIDGEALHLDLALGRRHWLVDSHSGQFAFDVPAPDTTPGLHLAISDRVRRFAAAFPDSPVELTLVDGETVVAKADAATAAIDLVASKGQPPRELRFQATATATVPLLKFSALMWSARTLPAGLDEPDYPLPPMWLQLADGTLGLHVDWSDFLPSRATYRLDATEQSGTATVLMPHPITDSFFRRVLDAKDGALVDLEVTFSVGMADDRGASPARPALRIEANTWRLTLWLFDHLQMRWGTRVERLVEQAGFELLDATDNVWTVRHLGRELTIGLHSGHPDVARVSTTLAHPVDETFGLLSELGQLNAASTGTRYWYADGTVRAVHDVRCDHLDVLPSVVHEVAEAARRFGPMLGHL